jgi:hypothetical protein
MIIALFILGYILVGWIVASLCLTIAMRNSNKAEADILCDFVIPFVFWPIVIIGSVIELMLNIIIWIGNITEKAIAKLKK